MKPEILILIGSIIGVLAITSLMMCPIFTIYWWSHGIELPIAMWYGCRIFMGALFGGLIAFSLIQSGIHINNKSKSNLKEEKVGAHPL